MIKIETRPADRQAWLAALHVKGGADDRLTEQMERAEGLLMDAANPKAVYRVMAREEITAAGFSIQKHLEGCHQVVLMGITLGMAVDELIRRTQITDMALAVLLDAGASVMAEQACGDLEQQIKGQMPGSAQLYFTSRFSPGYGDYPLSEQKRIHHLLDASRKIGLNLTRDSLMIPRKSITALMGIARQPVTGRLAGCEECMLKEKCTLRKEGAFCGNRF